MAFASSTEYSLWPTEAPSNPTSRGRPSGMIEMHGITSAASQVPTNAPSNPSRASFVNLRGGSVRDGKKNGVPTTSSQFLEQRQFADYQKSLAVTPNPQRANHPSVSPPLGLPPAIPSRSPIDSPERVESSTVSSSRTGRARIQRSTSDGYAAFQSDEKSQPLIHVNQPKPSRSSNSSPKPPRQSNSRNSIESLSASTNIGVGDGLNGGKNSPVGTVLCAADKPQLRRRPSVDLSGASRHRRSHSADVPRGERLHRSTSNSSLTSYALDSEAVKMLPDPRWGGGVGSLARSRSFSSENLQSMVTAGVGSYTSVDSSSPFGSIMGTDNKDMGNNAIFSSPMADQQPRLQLSRSEISMSSYSSGVSIDRSIEPVMTDMTKSAMFKGVTNKGVVKLQLPKDNFRLLSDRDLESGCVYKRTLVENEDDYFQDYHITLGDGQYMSVNCDTVHAPPKQLPPAYYVMAVDADIYQRMFDEVSESISMPCGLFYCGHHDDVDYPSIRIAMVGVMITLSVMLVATICVGG